MAMGRKSSLGRFARDSKGATAVEFAIVITPLLFVLLGVFQMAIIYFYDQALQSGSEAAARMLMTGTAQNASYTQAQFKTAVCNNAGSLFTCANVMVDVQSSTDFSNLNTTPITLTYTGANVNNTFAYNPGGPGSAVIVRVMYNFPIWWPVLMPGYVNQPNNQILLTATTVMKNEPYQ
jgi:Flp pilus assembly protein TadG